MRTYLLALYLLVPAAGADNFKAALQDLVAAERARNPGEFAASAAKLLKDDSARAVKEVVESYGRFASDRPALEPTVHYRVHSEVARALGDVTSTAAQSEIIRLREKAKEWQARLVCLDAGSFRPVPLGLRQGAIALLRDRSPAVLRRSLEYLKHDQQLPTLDAIIARFLELDGPQGPKGEDWNRARFAFCSALGTLLKVKFSGAVDYQGYVDARRDNPKDLFDRPAPKPGTTQLTIFGAAVTGNNIAFIIDVSGSMMATDPVPVVRAPKTAVPGKTKALEELVESRRRITRAKKELSKVVQGLPEGKKINIIAYSSDVVPWKKLLTAVNPDSRRDALKFIDGLQAEGITVTDDALEAAFTDLAVDTIYLITDGAPTHVGTQGSDLPPDALAIIDKILRRVEEVNYFRGVRIFTLGFPEAEENFLKKLAAANSADYTPIR
jgi:hypothetical protein